MLEIMGQLNNLYKCLDIAKNMEHGKPFYRSKRKKIKKNIRKKRK